MLLEGERIAFGATGRNGGFMDASLTHGIENGVARWPDEMPQLERLGRENFAAIKEAMARHGIDAGFEETGELSFAAAPYQADYIPEIVETARAYGWPAEALSAEQARAEVHSPTYHGAAYLPDGRGLVDPARLAWGLAAAARAAGVQVYERSPVARLERDGEGVVATTAAGPAVRARRAVLATSAFPPLVRAIRRYVVPVYDYVLVTEPLSARAARLARLGAPPGPHRPGQPVPLLPADGRRPHPVRRLRRHLQLPQRHGPPPRRAARPPSSCSPRTSSRPSPSSRACASPTAGVARSTPARASR